MASVTKEQIAAAKQMSAIEFLQRYRAADLVPCKTRGEYQLKSHDSFKINGSVWISKRAIWGEPQTPDSRSVMF